MWSKYLQFGLTLICAALLHGALVKEATAEQIKGNNALTGNDSYELNKFIDKVLIDLFGDDGSVIGKWRLGRKTGSKFRGEPVRGQESDCVHCARNMIEDMIFEGSPDKWAISKITGDSQKTLLGIVLDLLSKAGEVGSAIAGIAGLKDAVERLGDEVEKGLVGDFEIFYKNIDFNTRGGDAKKDCKAEIFAIWDKQNVSRPNVNSFMLTIKGKCKCDPEIEGDQLLSFKLHVGAPVMVTNATDDNTVGKFKARLDPDQLVYSPSIYSNKYYECGPCSGAETPNDGVETAVQETAWGAIKMLFPSR